jgi:hypothetical protein
MLAACSVAAGDPSSQAGEDLAALPQTGVGVVIAPPIDLRVTQLAPQTPLENRPVSLAFSVTNRSSVVHAGFVAAAIRPATLFQAPFVTAPWPIASLAPGQTVTGVLTFSAPMAAPNHSIDLYYQEGQACDPDHPCATSHLVDTTANFDSAARFRIAFDDIQIENTRSRFNDTDFASLSVTSDVSTYSQTLSLGDVDNGLWNVGLTTLPFDLVPGKGNPVKMGYLVVNKGYSGDLTNFIKTLNDIADRIADHYFPAGSTFFDAIHSAINATVAWLDPDCDGVVAADSFTIPTSELDSDTFFADRHRMHVHYPGSDSSTGCGSNSQYDVDSSILRERTAAVAITLPGATP